MPIAHSSSSHSHLTHLFLSLLDSLTPPNLTLNKRCMQWVCVPSEAVGCCDITIILHWGLSSVTLLCSLNHSISSAAGGTDCGRQAVWSSNRQQASFLPRKREACINPHSFPQVKVLGGEAQTNSQMSPGLYLLAGLAQRFAKSGGVICATQSGSWW